MQTIYTRQGFYLFGKIKELLPFFKDMDLNMKLGDFLKDGLN